MVLVLLGLLRGFRSDKLRRLRIEYITVSPGQGMTLFLPRSKSDRSNVGRIFKLPAVSHFCLVAAYTD